MDAERAVQKNNINCNKPKCAEDSAGRKDKELVALSVENSKQEADAKAYGISP